MTSQISDEQLMLAYQNGDIKAFEKLYRRHKGPLYRYFIRQLHSDALAEDLYQELWGKVIKAAERYQVEAKFTTWLYKIAHNLIIDHVRVVKPLDDINALGEDESLDNFESSSSAPDETFAQNRQAQLLQDCITLLPAVQKEAFLLNVEQGFTAAIISEIANATLEATKSRIRYAYQSLKACLSAKLEEGEHV